MSHLSRRALFGAGLTRLARTRFDAVAATSPPSAAPPVGPVGPDAGRSPAAGHRGRLAPRCVPAAERLVGALEIGRGDRLLDVAAGDGNVALAAAGRGARITAVESVPELVERGRARTEALGLPVEWHAADPEALPFGDGEFDCVASAFGVIYATDLRGTAAELERVLRPGGRLGLATWSSAGAMGAVLRAAGKGSQSVSRRGRPERWGAYEGLRLALERFAGFEVADETLRWCYETRDALWGDLVDAPAPPPEAGRDELERRLAPFMRETDGAIELRVDWCLTLAERAA